MSENRDSHSDRGHGVARTKAQVAEMLAVMPLEQLIRATELARKVGISGPDPLSIFAMRGALALVEREARDGSPV